MPMFEYTARSQTGQIQKGQLDVSNKDDVSAYLRKNRLILVSVREAPKQIKFSMGGPRVKTRDIVIFTRQFATMINAGLPLVQSLNILASQTENKTLADVTKAVVYDVESGNTLADAFSKHPKAFSNLYVNMVAAGEAGGILDTILLRLATFLEKNDALVRKVKGAMIYPGVIISVAAIAICILLVFVIPSFQSMWALGGLAVSRSVRLAATAFFAFGTVFWYAAQLGTTWFFAHVVAVAFLLLAVGLALRGDPEADAGVEEPLGRGAVVAALRGALRAPLDLLEPRQVLAGFLFGLACTARVTIAFGAPFFMLVGAGGSWPRRSVSAGVGAAIPIGALLLYNVASTGHLFTPVYEYLYRIEATGYPGLHYNPAWGLEDIRYIPQNLAIMFLSTPAILPDWLTSAGVPVRDVCTAAAAVRGLFDPTCPLAIPRDVGMGLLFTSPGYLLALPAIRGARSRLVAGAALAVLAIGIVNLMHFSQGWVQFGYRFSNDFVVFAVLLVAVGMARRSRVGWLGAGLIGVSIAINLWGVIWGNVLGW